MGLTTLLQRWFAPKRSVRHKRSLLAPMRRGPSFRPQLETLEARDCPAVATTPAGLVGWWSGDGNANDIAGNTPGTLLNGTSFAQGLVGQAFSFDGKNDLVDIGGTYSIQGARTIEAWVFPGQNTGYGLPIFTGGTSGHGDFFGIAGTSGSAAVGKYELYVDHWGSTAYDSNLALTPNAWNHVAMTYDGSTVRFYVNGVAGSAVTGKLYDYDLNTCDIGGNRIGGSSTKASMNGLIDEASFYNRALTAAEVQSIYLAGADGKNKFWVKSSSPAEGAIVTAPPVDFQVNLSTAYASATVQADDLRINGTPADSVTLTDADTLTFHYLTSPVVNQGLQTVEIAAGAIQASGSGQALADWSSTFRYDAAPLQATSINPAPTPLLTLSGTTATVAITFSEPVAPGSVSSDDLVPSQGSVSGYALSNGNQTITWSLTGLTEGALSLNIAAGALTDAYGNPGQGYTTTYDADIGTAPFAGPLQARAPLGSLVYQGTMSGQFNSSAVFVPAGSGGIDHPYCPVFGPDGKLYVVGNFSDDVKRYDPTTGAYLDTFISATSGGLDNPTQIAFGPDGNVYVDSHYTNSVLRYDGRTGDFLGVFVASGSGGLNAPTGMAFGLDGDLYVVSRFTDSVLRYDGTTGAFKGAFVSSGSGGLNEPGFIQWGPDGNLYVTSSFTDSILRYNGTTGAFIDAFVPSGSGGLDTPNSLLFGPDGYLYVATAYTNTILRYNGTTGAFVNTFVPSGAGGLLFPVGMTFGPDGRLYVGSADNDQVLRFDGTDGGPGDVDSYTLDLDANQTLALQVSAPAGTTVTATHSVLGAVSLGPDIDPGPGQLYQPVRFTDAQGNLVAGTVTISLQAPNGLSADGYSIQATLNAQFDTVSDGSVQTQSLAASTLDVEPGPVAINRAAALGSVEKTVARIVTETEGVTNNLRGSWDQVGNSTTWTINNGGGVTGSLSLSGNKRAKSTDASDTYTFLGQAGDVVTLRASGSAGGGGTLNGTTLTLQGPGTSVTGTAVPGASSDTQILSFVLPATGTYSVTVGTSNGNQGTYTLTANLVSPVSPRPNDADIYSVEANAGEHISAAVATGSSTVSSAQVQLALYAPGVNPLTGTPVATSNVSGSLDGLLDHWATTTGTYLVKVTGGPGLSTSSVAYTLVTTTNGSFDNTVNGSFATAQDITGQPGAVGSLSAPVTTFVPSGSGGLSQASEMTFGPDGNLYVSGAASSNVLRYDGQTGVFLGAFVPTGGGGLSRGAGVAFGPDGNLYVASAATSEVLRYDGQTGAFLGAFVPSDSGGLNNAVGLLFGPDGNLYVTSYDTGEVMRYDGLTGAPLPSAGNSGAVFVKSGSGGLSHPTGMVFGPDGNLYATGDLMTTVLKYDGSTGAFLGQFADGGGGHLHSMTIGPDGNLYVSNQDTSAVLRFDWTGALVDSYVPAGSGGLNHPTGVAFGPDGALYVNSWTQSSVLRKGPTPSPDYYNVTLTAGQTVTFNTSTPGDGAGLPANALDPRLELYDSSQALVATGTVLPDGRNEEITFTAPTTGTYYIKVSGQSLAEGDYVLDPFDPGEGRSSSDVFIAASSKAAPGFDPAGQLSYELDPVAINAIMAEWTRTDRTAAQRVDALKNGTGLNGTLVLNSTTISNDTSADVMTGSSGDDWFLFDSTHDRVTDLTDDAFADDLAFINGV